jgi:hypothetical protein
MVLLRRLGMNDQVVLLGASIGQATEAGEGRIRKQILPRNKSYRWPNQPGKMLSVTDDILSQIVKNFKAGTMDVVPFFKVNEKNGHTEDPEAARGKIVDVILTDDGLDAIIETASDAIRQQVLSTGLGASAGLDLAFKTRDDGTNIGAVLRHVAWTPDPWISGMRPFANVSLSNETYEAVFLSADDGHDNHDVIHGGDNEMTPEEIKKMVEDSVKSATADLSAALDTAVKQNEALVTQIATLSTALNQHAESVTSETVEAELSAMVTAGLPPAIADIAKTVLLSGTTEVELSGGEKSTVAGQMRAILALVPKVDFSEKGEAGVPEGHVVLSAEQVKALGFKVEKTEEDEGKIALSAEEKADAEAIAEVSKYIHDPA